MSPAELRAGASLAGVFGLRMFGLFLILPVFSVHAPQLSGGDNLTVSRRRSCKFRSAWLRIAGDASP
jgi:hypothetical protein